MKDFLPLLVLATLLVGCAPSARVSRPSSPSSPLAIMSTSPYSALKEGIDTLLPPPLFPPAIAGIMVYSLDRNEVLYELHSAALFVPASNQKLFTAAAALKGLGEEFLLTTIVAVDTSAGIISIRGCGDPLLSAADVDSLAALLSLKLPPRSTWDLLYDVSYFDDQLFGEGWAWDHEPASFAAFITPLMLNGNSIVVRAQPPRSSDDSIRVQTDPATEYVQVLNTAHMVRDTVRRPLRISRNWRERSNVILIDGEVMPGTKEKSVTISLWQPDRYAATVFAERLRARNIPVLSIVTDTLDTSFVEVLRLSHRVDSVITAMNKESENLAAEALLKTLGAERRGVPGSATGGISVVKELLAGIGIDTNGVAIADGSGLSRLNLTSPSVIIRLLRALHADPLHFHAFYQSLPIAGVDGTLKNRMRGTAAERNFRGKTGTLRGTHSLSGYVRTRDGELLAVSMMMQHFPGSASAYREVQDRIGALVAGMSRDDF